MWGKKRNPREDMGPRRSRSSAEGESCEKGKKNRAEKTEPPTEFQEKLLMRGGHVIGEARTCV